MNRETAPQFSRPDHARIFKLTFFFCLPILLLVPFAAFGPCGPVNLASGLLFWYALPGIAMSALCPPFALLLLPFWMLGCPYVLARAVVTMLPSKRHYAQQ